MTEIEQILDEIENELKGHTGKLYEQLPTGYLTHKVPQQLFKLTKALRVAVKVLEDLELKECNDECGIHNLCDCSSDKAEKALNEIKEILNGH